MQSVGRDIYLLPLSRDVPFHQRRHYGEGQEHTSELVGHSGSVGCRDLFRKSVICISPHSASAVMSLPAVLLKGPVFPNPVWDAYMIPGFTAFAFS